MLNPYIAIKTPTPLSGLYGLECYSKDQDQQERFVNFCHMLPRELQMFHQSGTGSDQTDYNLFEFWCSMTPERTDLLLEMAEKVAEDVGLELTIR